MSKPREFWIDGYGQCFPTKKEALASVPECPEEVCHVREVIEISDRDINKMTEPWENEISAAFEAGARWAIAKMKGEE